MKKTTLATFLLVGAMSLPLHALNLTPHEIVMGHDGPPMKRYFFQDGGKRLSFRLDTKMAVSGTENSAAFRFEDLTGAAMKMSRSQMTPAIPFDEKSLELYRAAARALVPADAANVQIEEETANAIAINDWTSHQFVFTYTLFARPCRRSVTFLNYSATEQFVIDVSATAEDFIKAWMRGYGVLNSLSDLPSDQKGSS